MTPAIPLITGWMCISLLFLAFPAWRGSAMAMYAGVFVLVTSLGGLLFDRSWQLLAIGLLMIGAAAAVGARMAQDAAEASGPGRRPLLAAGVRLIWVETPPDAPEWDGVRDRLQRAAASG